MGGLFMFSVWLMLAHAENGQLIVNVKNKGGEIMIESIDANTTHDIISLDFQKTDGTFIKQYIDFKNEIQILRVIMLGEEELGQTGYQAMCFITRLTKNEFISSDAMSKLRQKNPGAIRHPEEQKSLEEVTFDLMVNVDQAYVLSPHIRTVCQEARDATYVRDIDLNALSRSLRRDYTVLLGATKRKSLQRMQQCSDITELWRPCNCHYTNCVWWYPCGLKYCKGKDSTGKTVSYRCGIKTCSKCSKYVYYSRRKELCMWNLPNIGTFATGDNEEAPPVDQEEQAEPPNDADDDTVDQNMDKEYDPQ